MNRQTIFIVVPTIVAIAGIAVSILVPVWLLDGDSPSKELDASILADVTSAQTLSLFGSDLEILYKGEPASTLRLTDVLLRNSGNREIQAQDFDGPVIFRFNEGELLDAAVAGRSPENIRVTVQATKDQATLSPTLLNPGDSVTIRLISSAPAEEVIQVDFRIAGVSDIAEVRPLAEEADGEDDGNTLEFVLGLGGGIAASMVFTGYGVYIVSRVSRMRREEGK